MRRDAIAIARRSRRTSVARRDVPPRFARRPPVCAAPSARPGLPRRPLPSVTDRTHACGSATAALRRKAA